MRASGAVTRGSSSVNDCAMRAAASYGGSQKTRSNACSRADRSHPSTSRRTTSPPVAPSVVEVLPDRADRVGAGLEEDRAGRAARERLDPERARAGVDVATRSAVDQADDREERLLDAVGRGARVRARRRLSGRPPTRPRRPSCASRRGSGPCPSRSGRSCLAQQRCSGRASSGSASISAKALPRAPSIMTRSPSAATFKSGRPLCRVPRNSPGPRSAGPPRPV